MKKQSLSSERNDLIDQAEARTDQANTRTDEANTRAEQAERREEGISASELRYRRLFESAKDGILILDVASGMIVDVNPFLIKLLGYSHEVFLGKKIWELGFFKDIAANEAKFAELQARDYVRYEDLPLETADGRLISVEFVSNVYQEGGHKVIQCNIRDITELKRHDEDLILKEKAFRKISQGILITDANRLIISANQAFQAITGYGEEEIVGKNCKFLQGPQTDPQIVEKIRNALNHGVDFHGEILNYRKDGTIFWNELSISPVFDQERQVTHFVAVQRDITDRVNAQVMAAREHDQPVQLLRAATQVSIIQTDPQGIITIFNEGAANLLGYTPGEVIGRMNSSTIHLESEIVERSRELSAQMGRPIEVFEVFIAIPKLLGSETREWTFVRKDGSTFPVLNVTTCIRDDSGEITGYLRIATDLTQLKKTEEALLRSMRELEENAVQRMMIASSIGGVGIWEYDSVNNALTWDDQMFALYGVKKESFGGAYEASKEGLHPDDRQRGDMEFQMALSGEKQFNTEFRVCWPNGEIHHIRAIAKVRKNENGLPIRVIGTNWDITEEKKKELLLEETTERALSADRAKTEFLGVMSHEIRTPLNGILGFAELLLQEDKIASDVRDKISIIQSSGLSLLRIMEDILDFSRVEGGGLKLQNSPFSLSELAWKAIRLVEEGAKAKNLQLSVVLGETLPGTVLGDSDRIQQVLLNLLRNAIKFTERGSITLKVEVGNSGLIYFSVEDTGIGIPEKELGRIFLPFTQADSTMARKYDGIGMGLTISKRLLEKMGSTLTVKSQVGKGSIFSFELSFLSETSTKPEAKDADSGLGELNKEFAKRFPVKILIAEDNPINLQLAVVLLKKLGYEDVFTANHGGEALAILEKEKMDLIFMDLQMPVMDGMEATRQIRSLEAKHPSVTSVKIVALTANASADIREECFETGMNHYVSKPFNTRSLAEAIAMPH